MGRRQIILMIVFWLAFLAAPAQAKREHLIYLPGTLHQLDVYKIYGHKPGPTMMIIGGIQGNEPGSFLSADLYVDLSLERGNLIVVPRANFYSILLNERGPNGDMNRRFNQAGQKDYDAQIVEILKSLIAESDCLLNLHDGSGFFRPTYVNEMMNPMRFGQSIIADAAVYKTPAGRVINLAEMAQQVCDEVNRTIDEELFHFRFNNHRTMEQDSLHKEQRGSATFYALTRVGIPAFGIETSKELPSLELKLRHHQVAVNAFMRIFGIIPETPPVDLRPPELRYLVVSINQGQPIVVADKQTLTINKGDSIFISHIEANYERGLTADVLGLGGLNDFRSSLKVSKPTKIIVRRDQQPCGQITLAVKEEGAPSQMAGSGPVQSFVVQVNGERKIVAAGQTLKLIKGDELRLLEAWTESGQRCSYNLNFKGFVPPGEPNSGDDRQYPIQTDQGLLAKWSLEGGGQLFRVVAESGKQSYGEFLVQIEEPAVNYIIVQANDQLKYALFPGETLLCEKDDHLKMVDLKANFDTSSEVKLILQNDRGQMPLELGEGIRLKEIIGPSNLSNSRSELVVMRRDKPVGRVYLAPRPVRTVSFSAASPG